ncbi:RNA polymerase sigma factor [Symmachiella dynata]|uniref:RNA polymerase sigma factor n=1 Tax=Symmachiella dynata TaxID=2527995 RepID=A0A517ZQN2_9PLAN|nr:ECF-type sigma factor [Symmachiella dynata]QDT49132.1 RNA polymerase sigma factor [Symmachiella dynata]QDU44801.1 RNA polymerase sigma factor [Symmachiella dynata]
MADDESIALLARWEQGDEKAADEIFERYLLRLTALARSRLSNEIQTVVDPEDVVQSAYRTFFCNAGQRSYTLSRGGDLWRLLAAITVHKVLRQVEFHQAQKRSIGAVRSIGGSSWSIRPEIIARDPSPEEALAIAEELEDLMRQLRPKYQVILELRLKGESVEDIAAATGRTTRTVQRVMQGIRKDLEMRLFEDSSLGARQEVTKA